METLSGKVVVITRPENQSQEISLAVRKAGGIPLSIPSIVIREPSDITALHQALRSLSIYEWVIFTSVNGVDAVRRHCQALDISPDDLSSRRLVAIGPKTAKKLASWCRYPDLVPEEFISDRIPDLIEISKGTRVLLARANIARKELANTLRERGAIVDDVCAYDVVENFTSSLVGKVGTMHRNFCPDFITFTSPSTVRGFFKILNEAERTDWFSKSVIACVGPVTAREVVAHGLTPKIVANEYTTEGLLDALINYRS